MPRLFSRSFALLTAALALLLPSCSRDDQSSTVVLYSSVDSEVAKPILDEFEKRTGLKVLLVGDTEATKSTGLIQRLINEKDAPQADVWWSSEALGAVRLAAAGVLAPYASKGNDDDFERGWPLELRATDHDWYGFALRVRVFVYDKAKVAPADIPRTLVDLTKPRFKDRIGMARPEFGTTRGHIAALRYLAGDKPVDAWLAALDSNGVRYYDGNASVVRAISVGEIDVGLTDSDDVTAGKANGWPVEAAYEQRSDPAAPKDSPFGILAAGTGALLVPNTIALVKGSHHLRNAATLIDFLLSPEIELALAKSASGNIPIRPAAQAQFPTLMPSTGTLIDWEAVADHAK